MPTENQARTQRTHVITILGIGGDGELEGWVQQGLEGVPYGFHRMARLPEPLDWTGERTGVRPDQPRPSVPGSGSASPEGIDPDLAIVYEEAAADFAPHLKAFKDKNPRCQILLIGREDSALSPRQIGSALVRHWFFQPLEVLQLVGTLRAAGRSLSNAWREAQRHTRSLTGFDAFLGEHARLRETLDLARRVAQSPTTAVLIQGETGTGKGLLARAIHGEGPLRGGPFIDINCPGIPVNLLESELFGHSKGAFTGAVKDKPGLLELADGGTAFLDEIGELDLSLQAKILKFLDDGMVRRLQGANSFKVDVRTIAATHHDLQQEVSEGRFRLDLLHRLNVVVLWIPAVRDRGDDILLLARHYLEKFSRGLRGGGLEWSPEALDRLRHYSWPGNVRELINMTERLVLLADGKRTIGVEDLPPGIFQKAPVFAVSAPMSVAEVKLPPEGIPFEQIERAVLEAALKETKGNVTQAASLLQMGRGGLRYRLDRLKLTAQASNRRGRPMGRRKKAA